MRTETTSRVNPLTATLRATMDRFCGESPVVSVRKIGMFSGGLTMGNSAPMMSSVVRISSASASCIGLGAPHSCAFAELMLPGFERGIVVKEHFGEAFVCKQTVARRSLLVWNGCGAGSRASRRLFNGKASSVLLIGAVVGRFTRSRSDRLSTTATTATEAAVHRHYSRAGTTNRRARTPNRRTKAGHREAKRRNGVGGVTCCPRLQNIGTGRDA